VGFLRRRRDAAKDRLASDHDELRLAGDRRSSGKDVLELV
jgi:hypothetical protein